MRGNAHYTDYEPATNEDAETHGGGERPRPWLTQGIGASDFGGHEILQARKSARVLASLSAQIASGPNQLKAKARNRHLGRNSDDDGLGQAVPRGLRAA
jgi:hypothetical protein